MLCAEAGIEPLYDLAAAYVDHWRARLSDDPRLIVVAAAAAQRSCDFITQRESEDDEWQPIDPITEIRNASHMVNDDNVLAMADLFGDERRARQGAADRRDGSR